jgi:adenine-specific DNA-methyltransferase
MTTPFHAKYLAHELTKRLPADKAEKLSQSIANATVDLNPHQVEAALFAFRSPLSRGAILADEVGLGKTIEAGLIVSQLWAERKRQILCIVPASLRKQWDRELAEKFHIDSAILETKSYNQAKKAGAANPFAVPGKVVIVSYQFASAKIADVKAVDWDLVVIDEAHRLRNVYKKTNKIARNLRDAVGHRPKVLLTATPLQNSLLELYGLVTFIDDKIFGDEDSFRDQFCRRGDEERAFGPLKARLAPICYRRLRRDVTEYIRYPRRHSIAQDFTPTDAEQRLYQQVSDYLQKPDLHALPNSQRQLITLVLRKILASSSFAIGDTLATMIARLEGLQAADAQKAVASVTEVVGDDTADTTGELEEEWEDEAAGEAKAPSRPIAEEIAELRSYRTLAESIRTNAKGEALLLALQKGFEKAVDLGAPQKVLIFTESRRTQLYLLGLLEANGYGGKVVLFNGTNADPASKGVYKSWLTRHAGQETVSGSPSADMRTALVEEFKDRAQVMIATESAAEGVNLQFCNLVVNYDLPWNPQRIEQRIGRCHRYGQKHDVVVINFLNRANQADARVFELLDEKLKLFDGVFGASDEVLGALESGIDFEKRIHAIYQGCRTPAEINAAFDALQKELDTEIAASMSDARSKLFEHFDPEVRRTLKLRDDATRSQLNRFEDWLWRLTKIELGDAAAYDTRTHRFRLTADPAGVPGVSRGPYLLDREHLTEADIHYRAGHPLAEALIERARTRPLAPARVEFRYDRADGKLGLVERLRGRSGWLRLTNLSVAALETEDTLVFSGFADDGERLEGETCVKLMAVPGAVTDEMAVPPDILSAFRPVLDAARVEAMSAAMNRNQRYYEAEMEKLDAWAEDLKSGLDREIREMELQITEAKKQARLAPDLPTKLTLQKHAGELERQRNAKRKNLFDEQDRISAKKDSLLDEIAGKLTQQVTETDVFTIRWAVV